MACHPVARAASPAAQPAPESEKPSASQQQPLPEGNRVQGSAACLECHQRETLSLTFENGETLSLYLQPEAYEKSVHGGKLACTDCHANVARYPHPKTRLTSRRDYVIAQYDTCKRCHFANYTKTLDSVHYQVFSTGEKNAPVCTDCHTAHTVALPAEPRAKISDACGRCHTKVYEDYAGSVHGWALLDEGNPDVPVCTTCHGVHSIQSASSASFHLASTELCAKCHSDKKLMDKYGISSNVLQTYLDDFHGKTVSFARQQSRTVWSDKAVCTDCHGVHEIKKTDDPTAPTMKANLSKTCQKCHPEATENFSAAWLSHYDPSLKKASIVYLVKAYYWILIPAMVGGLALHILLDLWRLARNR
ncbi:MAG: cytochrome C [Chloroflexi bacterium]|nr:cytochrome C [Chloroflexota bacterium]